MSTRPELAMTTPHAKELPECIHSAIAPNMNRCIKCGAAWVNDHWEAALRAFPSQAEAVGDWVTVPRAAIARAIKTLEDDGDELGVALNLFALLSVAPQPPAASVEWDALHPATEDLVQRFAQALREKLAAAERKYGYSDGWLQPDWMDECRQKLVEHVAKGDPRDVAAYCAFLWHHGERTALASVEDLEAQAREAIRFAKYQLERHVDMMMPECDCEDCPQCGKPPRDCSGTACASTCQCRTCDHCSAKKSAIAALDTALRTRSRGVDVGELRDLAPRALELANRLVASGPKAAHVSASECHEIAEFVRATVAIIDHAGKGDA